MRMMLLAGNIENRFEFQWRDTAFKHQCEMHWSNKNGTTKQRNGKRKIARRRLLPPYYTLNSHLLPRLGRRHISGFGVFSGIRIPYRVSVTAETGAVKTR
jgi:hypothetical protein